MTTQVGTTKTYRAGKFRYQVYQSKSGFVFTARIITGRDAEPYGAWGDPGDSVQDAIRLAIVQWKMDNPHEYIKRPKPIYGFGSH